MAVHRVTTNGRADETAVSRVVARVERRRAIIRYRGRYTSNGPNTAELRKMESESERREDEHKFRRTGLLG